MKPLVLSVAALCLAAPAAAQDPPREAAPGVDRARLRKAVRFPVIRLRFGFVFFTEESLGRLLTGRVGESEEARRAELARLEREEAEAPGDARRLLGMSRLARDLGDVEGAAAYAGRAASVLEAGGGEGTPPLDRLLDLAEALGASGQGERARKVLDGACRDHPREDRAWAASGALRATRAAADLAGTPFAGIEEAFTGLFVAALVPGAAPDPGGRPFAEALAAAERDLDRAVSLAPARGDHHVLRALVRGMALYPESRKDTRGLPLGWVLARSVREDLRRALDLGHGGPDLVLTLGILEASAVLFEVMPLMKGKPGEEDLWDRIPPESRGTVLAILEGVEPISKGEDRDAAVALRIRAMVRGFLRGDLGEAETLLAASLRLDPEPAEAWNQYLMVLALRDRKGDLADACEKRLAREETADLRLLAAKAAFGIGDFKRARVHLDRVLETDPSEPRAHLGRAALALAGDPPDLAGARHRLDRVEEALEDEGALSLASVDYAFLLAVSRALEGNPEDAREILSRIVEQNPGDAEAREALAALGPGDGPAEGGPGR